MFVGNLVGVLVCAFVGSSVGLSLTEKEPFLQVNCVSEILDDSPYIIKSRPILQD